MYVIKPVTSGAQAQKWTILLGIPLARKQDEGSPKLFE